MKRGSFMKKSKKLLALALATAMVGASMVGCGSSRAGSSASGTTSGSQMADTITFAQGADPRGLDPAYVDDGESAKIMCNIYEGLLKYNKDSTEVEPCLAKSWDISDDGLTYTFHLQEGVKFQDGTDFNADAVKKSIDRQLEPNRSSDMPYASFVYGAEADNTGVKAVKVVDTNTVEIDLRSANTAFLKNMAMCMAAPIVSPTALEKNKGNLNEAPCGTGPYTFVSWNKGQSVVLKKNDNYWDKDNAAKTENIVFRFIAENAARVTALNNGEVDVIDGIDDTVVPTIQDAGNKIFNEDGMTINYMAYNTKSDTFKNAAARKAVNEAINVPELVKALYGDYASVANSVMPTFMAPYDTDIQQTQYDPEKAKTDLAAAGVTKIKMLTYTNPRPYNTKDGQQLAETIKGYLDKVGVDCEIDAYDWTTYKQKIETESYDVAFYGWTGDNGDPDNFMNLLADKTVSMNIARYDDPTYRALIQKGIATKDGADRDAVYKQCEQMVADQNVWLLISHSKNLCGYNSKVQGFYYHQTGITPFAGVTKTK